MKKKQNLTAKIFAGLALFGIIISIIGTALLVIMNTPAATTQTLSVDELQELINTDSIKVTTASGAAEVNVIQSEKSGVIRGVED